MPRPAVDGEPARPANSLEVALPTSNLPALGPQPIASVVRLVTHLRPRQAVAAMAKLKADLEERVRQDPDDYDALVGLGEVNLRIGLAASAQALLYHASLLRQPDWESYQYLSYLLRRAEEQQQHAMDRPAGVPPPSFLRRSAGSIAKGIASTIRRLRIGRWT